ncbi:cytochrome P450 [Pestalotiopsis sp. NC0098]|nr:cytochrome P450 [Pestalotiopsis sp. NC0098]
MPWGVWCLRHWTSLPHRSRFSTRQQLMEHGSGILQLLTQMQTMSIPEPTSIPPNFRGLGRAFRFRTPAPRLVSGGANQEQALHALGALVKLGRWIQVIEATNELPEGCGPVMQAFVNVMNGVFRFMGADLKLADKMPGWLRGTGFVDIQDRIVPLRLGASNPDASLAAQGVFSTSAAAGGLGNFAKIYFVLADLSVEKRLREDLKEATAKYPAEVPRWADLEKIPYLAGCIKEGLRLARFMRRSPRILPDQDLIYKQWVIPKNTPVAMSVCHLHMDPDVYPEPYKFIPERWMGDVDPRVTRNFVPIRQGIAKLLSLAWSELYIVLAILFRPGGHKMSLDCDESDIVPVHDSDVGA